MVKLRLLRLLHGYTQDELAKKIHMSQNYVSLLERKRRRPSKTTRARLAGVFKISERDLFGE